GPTDSLLPGGHRQIPALPFGTKSHRSLPGGQRSGPVLPLIAKSPAPSGLLQGGFVAFPVTIGAWLNRIPVILHESDLTPGLANRLALPFANTVCATFTETMKHLPTDKRVLTGNPLRPELLTGSREQGLKTCGFTPDKPVLLVAGGSLGSVTINKLIRAILPDLLLQ